MEEDGERAQLLQNILDLLLTGGYFRARISTLSAFDKLTGGLAWCITFSKVDVDFDIFYDDDATLYYKIKVGEAIEEALQRMGCPHPLQAHQIQGLDYSAVLPVVQWLVKRVQSTLGEFGDQARIFAHLRFQENYELPNESSLHEVRLESVEDSALAASVHVQEPAVENLDIARVRVSSPSGSDEQPHLESQQQNLSRAELKLGLTDARSAAGSYPHFTSTKAKELSPEPSDAGHLDDTAYSRQVRALEKQVTVQARQNLQLGTEIDAATISNENLKQAVIQQDERSAKAQSAYSERHAAAKAAGVEDVVQKVMELVETSKSLETQEVNFRAECKKERAKALAHIKQLNDPSAMAMDDDGEHGGDEMNNAYHIDRQKWMTLRSELSRRNRAVALLQRRLDDLPSQTELMQYERRFVELYLHIQRKLRETRKYYSTYNALAEAHELTVKELSLLNSIHAQFEMAMMTPRGRAKFVESMEGIAKGVQQKLQQIERRYEAEKSTVAALKEVHITAVAAQRQYYAVVKLLQDECARSEKLQSRLQ